MRQLEAQHKMNSGQNNTHLERLFEFLERDLDREFEYIESVIFEKILFPTLSEFLDATPKFDWREDLLFDKAVNYETFFFITFLAVNLSYPSTPFFFLLLSDN